MNVLTAKWTCHNMLRNFSRLIQHTYIIISSESLTACGATRVIASAAATTDTVINYLSVLVVLL